MVGRGMDCSKGCWGLCVLLQKQQHSAGYSGNSGCSAPHSAPPGMAVTASGELSRSALQNRGVTADWSKLRATVFKADEHRQDPIYISYNFFLGFFFLVMLPGVIAGRSGMALQLMQL